MEIKIWSLYVFLFMGVITTGCTKENPDKIKESNELTNDELPNIAPHPKKAFRKVAKYPG